MDFQLLKCQRLLLLKDETDSGVLFQFPEVGNQDPQECAVQVRTPFSAETDSYDGQGAGGKGCSLHLLKTVSRITRRLFSPAEYQQP